MRRLLLEERERPLWVERSLGQLGQCAPDEPHLRLIIMGKRIGQVVQIGQVAPMEERNLMLLGAIARSDLLTDRYQRADGRLQIVCSTKLALDRLGRRLPGGHLGAWQANPRLMLIDLDEKLLWPWREASDPLAPALDDRSSHYLWSQPTNPLLMLLFWFAVAYAGFLPILSYSSHQGLTFGPGSVYYSIGSIFYWRRWPPCSL